MAIGDEIEVYVERMEDQNGQAVLSRDKARREEAWAFWKRHRKQERVRIIGKVKGGFTVDCPVRPPFAGSQVDIPPARPWSVNGHTTTIPNFEN